MSNIISGKELSNIILDGLKNKISKIKEKRLPKIAIVQVGDNSASNKYIKHKIKGANNIGMLNEYIKLKEDITQSELELQIKKLNEDTSVDGIIVQLPLPKQINANTINSLIYPSKDADGFNPTTIGNVVLNNTDIYPATPSGIIKLLEWKNINLVGSNVVIIGRSNIVGKPLANILINKSATVTICNTKTRNLEEIATNADILISAAGSANLINKNFINKNTVVIDVGANFIDGHYCGDVNFSEVGEIVKYITPVPGGVGPMTIACLLENVYKLYLKNN
ncbi:methylenetetrahydrofolate dehydrogenase/methylenetetrahydrofolate cyclohydrolase [Spiroplasma helicoides]|uniref:Bifunctional protein FolD n=1 Tax=Spiroplasma helicoides TaxID=216938 RepID=A0A1B3SJK4_9MOLU|nr:bifunctional 5,10-methylenetetrahydrofolate dehydrogenase/5,10-methenyltetrahydrofolate cyclohydrolase [Spiroplasma helicoides]AOG60108.1 methylenetetrahydrofolate dehydrogenase/methylenetetrahydrofolate cyclohydrolase [Spiroplasma helicoides]